MPRGPLTSPSRDLLRSLTALINDRVRREVALGETTRNTTASAETEFSATTSRADEDYDSATKDLTSAHKARRAQLESRANAAFEQGRVNAIAELRDFKSATEALEAHGQRQHEEALWLAETVVESGEKKLATDLDQSRKSIELHRRELTALTDSTRDILARFGYDPTSAPAPAQESATPTDLPTEPSTEPLDAAVASARTLSEQVKEQANSHSAGFSLTILLAILFAAAAALGAWFLNRRTTNELAIAAGAGLVLGLIIGLIIRAIARKRLAPHARRLAEILSSTTGSLAARIARFEADNAAGLDRLHQKRDEETTRAKREFERTMLQVQQRRSTESPALEARRRSELVQLKHRSAEELARLDADHNKSLADSRAQRDSTKSTAQAKRDTILADLKRTTGIEYASLESTWKQGVSRTLAQADLLAHRAASLCPPWQDPSWSNFDPPDRAPPAIAFGSIAIDISTIPGGRSSDPALQIDDPTTFTLPAGLDIGNKSSLFIQHTPDSRAPALAALRDAMLRLLTTFPPGKVRFTILDPVGLGQNFAGFMHLADHDPLLVSDRIWTEARHIEQKLTDLTEHMENVIQKYLRNEYETIQEYNDQAGEIAEPYRFLVIADFPANFTEPAARRLASIVSAGARCGVFTLIACDIKQKFPHFAPVAEIERYSQTLAWQEDRFVWKDEDFSRWPLALESPPPEDQFNGLINSVGAAARDASRVQVPFDNIAPADGELWSLSAADELRVALGRTGAKKLQYLTLGRGTRQHALIAGRTGSGKSTLLHVMVTNLALWYSPDEVELYLIDFKKGVEFKTYATHGLPHARVIAVESEREFGLSVLRRLDAELTRRGQLFREAGVQDLPAFRTSAPGSTRKLPRILLLVDEFQEFFTEDDKLAQEAALLLDRLVRQGRAFGMHLVLGSQTLGGAFSIARSTMGQMAVRIALQSSEADSLLIMSDDNTAPRLLTRPGEAIYNDANGAVEGNSPFQIVWLPEEERENRLEDIHTALARHPGPPPTAPIIFEGNIPANPASNHLLTALLKGIPPEIVKAGPTIWLGDAISIKDPTSVTFKHQSASNLLIVGQHDDAALAMLQLGLLSLAAQQRPDGDSPRLFLVDGLDTLRPLAESLPIPTRIASTRDTPAVIAEVFAELRAREAPETQDAADRPPVFLVIHGLQRFRDLRKGDEFSFSAEPDKPASPAEQFTTILRDGPSLGIHILAWCDTVSNLERCISRNSLREFDFRVLFQMSASDSSHLIDSPAATSLGAHRAMLFREESAGIEKFRPYALPQAAWLASALADLRSTLDTSAPARGRGSHS